jgi:hypothetical protein
MLQDGKYELAREAYTASLGVKATHLAFANRAMASLKLRDFSAAEADSTSAIDLEPGYVKVHCLMHLGVECLHTMWHGRQPTAMAGDSMLCSTYT